ncbi:hypothetical protein HELRODRAFT_168367 [Helobdella robusta]|uniref:Uncharacterized protein n=1 Tax=Helobdella robusta TaxID=6412 RepID=T1F0H5_HELRO|nr:hypothetical protein HELRODRAFT_168367 [Helobdella robusta]ESO09386.1 hypothetical protein HELRODRAFT_168367 [Helobdella robusta]
MLFYLIVFLNIVGNKIYVFSQAHRDFKYFYNNYHGNCYTFNSAAATGPNSTLKISRKSGPRYGLSILFYLAQDEYVGQLAQSAGLRVVVHDPKRMPFPEDEGILVAANSLTHIGVTMTQTKKLNGLYGNCSSEDDTDRSPTLYQKLFKVSYCQKGCLYTCLNDEILKNCGCFDIKFPLDEIVRTSFNTCSVANESLTTCANNVWKAYENESLLCSSKCTVPCRETIYKPIISRENWPSSNYLADIQNIPSLRKIAKYLSDYEGERDYGQFIVYIQDFSYTTIEESEAYQIMQFTSDVGGILGLYIGFSLLTVVEFFELAVDIIGIIGYQVYLNGRTTFKNWKRENRIKNCNRVIPDKEVKSTVNIMMDDEEVAERDMDPRAKPRTGAPYYKLSSPAKQELTSVHI